MQEHIKKSFYYRILNINFLLVCPLAVLAPVATWIPLVLSSLLLIFFSKKFFKGFKVEANYIYLILASSWMVFSVLFLSRDIFFLQKLIEFFILVFSALIFNWAILNIPKFNKIIVLFSTSFIFSCLLIILDFQLELGLKLWLSKNFDFSNFQSFYQLKSWVSLYEFRNQQNSMILNYLNNTYDRGITSLIILALPISTICYLYNYKLLGLSVFILSLILTLIYSTFALKIAYMFSIIFASIFYLKYDLFKKYFLFFLALYFLLSPFILGVFNYKEFSNYEKKILQNNISLAKKYCDKVDNLAITGYLSFNYNNTLNLKCGYGNKNSDVSFFYKNSEIFNLEKKFHQIIVFIKSTANNIVDQKLHRLIIWSYVKEKIIEKPIIGNGFFSSRNIANETLITERGTNYQLIPLHPHNSILQIWLELGGIGLFLFFLFIKFLITKIFKFAQSNHKVSTVAIISFFLIFFIGHASFGLWQSWWISIIAINIILYNFIFIRLRHIC